MKVGQRVTVIGPRERSVSVRRRRGGRVVTEQSAIAASAQLGKSGKVVGTENQMVQVVLDHEDRPRNFNSTDLSEEAK